MDEKNREQMLSAVLAVYVQDEAEAERITRIMRDAEIPVEREYFGSSLKTIEGKTQGNIALYIPQEQEEQALLLLEQAGALEKAEESAAVQPEQAAKAHKGSVWLTILLGILIIAVVLGTDLVISAIKQLL